MSFLKIVVHKQAMMCSCNTEKILNSISLESWRLYKRNVIRHKSRWQKCEDVKWWTSALNHSTHHYTWIARNVLVMYNTLKVFGLGECTDATSCVCLDKYICTVHDPLIPILQFYCPVYVTTALKAAKFCCTIKYFESVQVKIRIYLHTCLFCLFVRILP